MTKFSYSRISSYLSCPRKHYNRYVLKLRTKKVVRPLSFGKDFHKLLEHRADMSSVKEQFAIIKKSYKDMKLSDQVALGEDYLKQLKTVFTDYMKVYSKAELPIATEHEFMVHVATFKGEKVYMHGLFDEEYEDLTLGEHKTFNRRPAMGILNFNMQTCIYAKIREIEMGAKFRRVMWDYVKSAQADYPVWLDQAKRFSTAKSDKITPYSWLRACKERGITDPKVLNMAEAYRGNISNFFFRTYTDITSSMADNMWEDMLYTMREITLRGERNRTMNVTRECEYCDYRPLCYAEFTGVDTSHILSKEFTVDEDRADLADLIEEA